MALKLISLGIVLLLEKSKSHFNYKNANFGTMEYKRIENQHLF